MWCIDTQEGPSCQLDTKVLELVGNCQKGLEDRKVTSEDMKEQ